MSIVMPFALALAFGITALLYASVGFGGGSTYNALLVLAGTDYRILPAIALICNIIVVAGGSWRYAREGCVPWARLWPILLLSAPLAWLGGRIAIERDHFVLILGLSLLVAAILMLTQRESEGQGDHDPRWRWAAPLTGAGVGLLSGLVGIGGGIFLAPVLHLARWAPPRVIAGSASVFILINSLAGLAGQASKIGSDRIGDVAAYWPLVLGVLVGGQIGSLLGARILPPRLIRIATALLIAYVAIRLLLI
ncbi:sulfite exporter TauE/SafE family protein [Flavisphingopyxis soli]|nr:sulfite exporter TauE/SafE family protein [Sphingorhabdus soli]